MAKRPRNHEPRNRHGGRYTRLSVEALELRALLTTTADLVVDLNSTAIGVEVLGDIVAVGPTAFFAGDNGQTGWELYKSDGAESGAVLVKDIFGGAAGSRPHELVYADGALFFATNDGNQGYALWKSDGTAGGTVLVKSLIQPKSLTEVNGTVFFNASDGVRGYELWKSNGTSAGTVLVKDGRTGAGDSYPRSLTNVSGTLFFTANDGINGDELWKSDGTAAGTVLVKDIRPGANGSYPYGLTNVNGKLFFGANDGVSGFEIWTSLGAAAETVRVADIAPGVNGSESQQFTNVNGMAFFVANDGVTGVNLWKSDGTAAGTALVKDIRPGLYSRDADGNAHYLTNLNGTLFFVANDGSHGNELWKSDGTSAGTTEVLDIRSGLRQGDPRSLTNVGGTLFFSAVDPTDVRKLWKSDGTAAGTTIIRDGAIGSSLYSPSFENVNGMLIFGADNDPNRNAELWKSDGSAAGTQRLPFQGITNSAGVGGAVNVNGVAFFVANDGSNGYELWKTDGTAPGTVLVEDVEPGGKGSYPRRLTNANGTLFFTRDIVSANFQLLSTELWKSDGTASGTVLVSNLELSAGGEAPQHFTVAGNLLFFTGDDLTNRRVLWRSDGTGPGTFPLKNLNEAGANPSTFDRYPIVNVGSTLYFRANDGANGSELWKTDGTVAGTSLVKDIATGSAAAYPDNFLELSGALLFSARDISGDWRLWKSDGTAAGTLPFTEIESALGTRDIGRRVNVNGQLFFLAFDNQQRGSELWTSNGTTSGTVLLKDLRTLGTDSYPRYFTNANGRLFFTLGNTTGGQGNGLWTSNGTAGGTALLWNTTFETGGYARSFTNVGGTLFFTGRDARGVELWKSDGTASGTFAVKDIWPGASSSYPASLTPLGNRLLFSATDERRGRELWITAERNTAPTFVSGPTILAFPDDSGPQTMANWASGMSAGPPDEAGQALQLLVMNDNNSLFSVQPTIDAAGQLSFTPRPNAAGSAQVTVVLKDNGGTANGGSDSSLRILDITITKPHRWHNSTILAAPLVGALDVDANGVISPFDAILVINYLNSDQPSAVPTTSPIGGPSGVGPGTTGFLDTGGGAAGQGDNVITPFDAILVINWLNAHPATLVRDLSAAAEAEADSDPQPGPAATTPFDVSDQLSELIAFLSIDTANWPKRRRI